MASAASPSNQLFATTAANDSILSDTFLSQHELRTPETPEFQTFTTPTEQHQLYPSQNDEKREQQRSVSTPSAPTFNEVTYVNQGARPKTGPSNRPIQPVNDNDHLEHQNTATSQISGNPRHLPILNMNNCNPTRSTTVSISDVIAIVKPFTGQQTAEKWLQQYQLYTAYKNITGKDKIDLFKLLLADSAADWLSTLSLTILQSEILLMQAFKDRFGLSIAQKMRTEKEMWTRDQREDESVDQYVTHMQIIGSRVNMPQEQLLKLIIQGLKPELRMFVLQANAGSIAELLTVSRTCEAARSIDHARQPTTAIDMLTSVVGALTAEVAKLTARAEMSVRTQAAVTTTDPPVRNDYNKRSYEDQKQRTWTQKEPPQQQQVQFQRPHWTPARYAAPIASSQSTQWSQPTYAPMEINHNAPHQWTSRGPTKYGLCKFCNKMHEYGRNYCGATNARCQNCLMVGHYQTVCYRPPAVRQNTNGNH
jgi:hypothetical protein